MILIDERVGSAELLGFFGKEALLARLEFGDFMFCGNGPKGPITVGIERKTVKDLYTSILSERLRVRQFPGMCKMYTYNYIIVEGIFRINHNNNTVETRYGRDWSPVEVGGRAFDSRLLEGFITSSEVQFNVNWRYTPTMDATARCVGHLYRWWNKPWDKHGMVGGIICEKPKAIIRRATLSERVAVNLPGVRDKRGTVLARAFRSVHKLVNASVEEFKALDGIGTITANEIYTAIRTDDYLE